MDDKHQRALDQVMATLRRSNPDVTDEEEAQIRAAFTGPSEGRAIDVLYPWKAAMFALGYGNLTEIVVRADIIAVAPFIMVGFGVVPDSPSMDELDEDEHEAVQRAIYGVLRAARWPVSIEDDGRITIDMSAALEQMRAEIDPWHDAITSFRSELDRLYPDNKPDDPLSKWITPKEDQ
jgi:hypothetical protein